MRDPEVVLQRINAGEYGLAGSVWSSDRRRARDVAERMACGTVWINQHLAVGPDIPTAGARRSGVGVEWGTIGLEEFTQVRVVNEVVAA